MNYSICSKKHAGISKEFKLNTYLMKKAMIESAVSQGIRQMKEDPERSARRLVDLGKQFSHNRFQDMIFSVIQELLDNDRSSYYDMIHNLLKNTDEKAIQKFGVNFGYMGWTYGASRIREEENDCGHCLPWSITMRYDEKAEGCLSLQEMEDIITQGEQLGIYVYFIRETGNPGDYALLEVFERHRDSAFVLFSDTGRVTAAQIQILKLCKNTVISFPVDDPESMLTTALLRDQKIFFCMHYVYSDDDKLDVLPNIMESVIAAESPFLFGIAKDGTSREAIQYVTNESYSSRLSQTVPTVCIDFYGDNNKLSKAICEHSCMFEIGSDGTVLQDPSGKRIDTKSSLLETFQSVMPAFPAENSENRK